MITLDTSKSYLAIQGTESVTWFSKATESTFAAGVTVNFAKRRAPDKAEDGAVSGALIFGVELVWHVWTAQLSGIIPKVGDVIQDAATIRWTVVKVHVQSFKNRYQCETYREQ